MSKVVTNSVVLGQSGTDTNNFLLDTDAAGALRIRRKSDGSGGTVLTIDSSGIPKDKDGNDIRPLGVGQTWQNVLGSRTQGTTYTNTTGRPICVAYSGYSSSATGNVVVNGVTLFSGLGRSTYFNILPVSFVVPPGGSYSISNHDSTSSWAELR